MIKLAAIATALCVASAAHAIVVDGSYDAAYGAPTAVIPYSAGPNGTFGNYGSAASPGYSIYLDASDGYVYGFFKADTSAGGAVILPTFANVYFDIDPGNNNGSDLVFELKAGSQRVSGLYDAPMTIPAAGITVAVSGDNTGIEFAIPQFLFHHGLFRRRLCSEPGVRDGRQPGDAAHLAELQLRRCRRVELRADPPRLGHPRSGGRRSRAGCVGADGRRLRPCWPRRASPRRCNRLIHGADASSRTGGEAAEAPGLQCRRGIRPTGDKMPR